MRGLWCNREILGVSVFVPDATHEPAVHTKILDMHSLKLSMLDCRDWIAGQFLVLCEFVCQ